MNNSVIAPGQCSWAAHSSRGVRKDANEDSYEVFTLTWGKEQKPVIALVVADGISATDGGEQASQIAVDTIKSVLMEPTDSHETTSDRMAQALTLANQEILFHARQNPQWSRMGTTVVLAIIVDDRLYVMGLGDSRAYLVRNQEIYRLTTDHTWAQYNLDANNGQANYVRQQDHSRLVRYLGNPNGVHIDRGVVSPDSQEKEEYIAIESGDAVLLCSDGLYKLISDDEVNAMIALHAGESDDAITSLIALARQKGERDDITAILLNTSQEATALEANQAKPGKQSERGLRFALATVIALALVVFQLNYRRSSSEPLSDSTATAEITTIVARASLGTKLTSTRTPTATTIPTATDTPFRGNGTIPLPPTQVLPTAALPTSAVNSSGN